MIECMCRDLRLRGGETVKYAANFVIAILSRVIGDYISKWLDGRRSDK